MTSTNFNVGLNTDSRNSSKVLKPPGGGSSDIFGTTSEPVEPQRKNRSHLTSSIFGGEETVAPSRNKAGNDSFYNLFGTEPQSRPASAVKNNIKNNIVINHDYLNTVDNSVSESLHLIENCDGTIKSDVAFSENTQENIEGGKSNGLLDTNGPLCDDCEDVNTVIGETPSVNGSSSSNSAASTTAPTPTASAAPGPAKQRIPPGGFSSGLW